MVLPPHLIKYLAKTFCAWHAGAEILQTLNGNIKPDHALRDTVFDALVELYAEMAEDDLFYGLWRRRCLHTETNVGLAFEQNGMWEHASVMYENAQAKSRAGALADSRNKNIAYGKITGFLPRRSCNNGTRCTSLPEARAIKS